MGIRDDDFDDDDGFGGYSYHEEDTDEEDHQQAMQAEADRLDELEGLHAELTSVLRYQGLNKQTRSIIEEALRQVANTNDLPYWRKHVSTLTDMARSESDVYFATRNTQDTDDENERWRRRLGPAGNQRIRRPIKKVHRPIQERQTPPKPKFFFGTRVLPGQNKPPGNNRQQ